MLLAETAMKWAEIAERLGIPFAILLFFLMATCAAAMWTAKNVVRPVVNSHLKFVNECGSAINTLKQQETEQTAAINALREDHKCVKETVEEVHSHVKQVKGMLARRDRGTESNGAIPAA